MLCVKQKESKLWIFYQADLAWWMDA